MSRYTRASRPVHLSEAGDQSGSGKRLKRRMFVLLLLATFAFVLLLGRLTWIQLIARHQFSSHHVNLVKEAVEQRKENLILDLGRGELFDRHGVLLTGGQKQALVVFPVNQDVWESGWQLGRLAEILGLERERLAEQLAGTDKPMFLRHPESGKTLTLTAEQAEAINALKLPGVLALPVKERYEKDGIAKHVIGTVGRNPALIRREFAEELEEGTLTLNSVIGVAGLERSFQPFLQGIGATSVSYFVDGRGRPLNGLDIRIHQPHNEFYPLALITTLDAEIQRMVEKAMDENGLEEGAVVVLDREANVLAMASRPDFDPRHVDFQEDNWRNRAIQQTIPGSVFKTVIAAAALDTGTVNPDDEFVCEGEYGKYGFSCWKEGGHGRLTFAEAYAQSCNITFAKVARLLGPEKIKTYAQRLGVVDAVGWREDRLFKIEHFRQFDGEDAGRVFAPGTPEHDEGVLMQTAIGQRDVRMTPLQAANMVLTILNDGRRRNVRIVQRIEYKNGSTFFEFPVQSPRYEETEKIDRYTAYRLRKMMSQVVEEGTGEKLREARWPLAGKSGTAQIPGESDTNHQWFVGYGPAAAPQYAVAVLALNRKQNGPNVAIAVFGDVMDGLAELTGRTKD
ncbi:penicillin-binding protein 2 [Bacillaceae bacterium]